MLSVVLSAALLLGVVPGDPVFAADYGAVDYLQLGDYVTILPAEDKYGPVDATTWAINVQDGGHLNGQDIQMWEMGTSVKMVVRRYDDGKNAFALIPTNFRESQDEDTDGAKFWDLEGKDTDDNTTIHVWADDDLNDENKLFFLKEDNDGDPETFYLCSYYAAKEKGAQYLAPRDYPKKSWDDNGRNIVLSEDPFRWRVQVLNRAAKGVEIAWMDRLSDNLYLSEVNIPGTHDAATANVEGSWNENTNIVACQKYFIDEQLLAGVRSFDIRYTYKDEEVVLVHGGDTWVCHNKDHGDLKGTNMTLEQVLETCVKFLRTYPSETVIMTIKQDGGGSDAPAAMADVFTDCSYGGMRYLDYCYNWSESSPKMEDVRGKIVIMTRSEPSTLGLSDTEKEYFGPDLSSWNYDDDIHLAQKIFTSTEGVSVWVQDDYQSGDGNKKKQVHHVLEQLNGVAGMWTEDGESYISEVPALTDFVFNYTSKTTSNSDITPLSAARVLNEYLIDHKDMQEYFAGSYWHRSGITVVDYVDKALAQYIVESNFLPRMAATGGPGTVVVPPSDIQGSVDSFVFSDVVEDDAYFEDITAVVDKGYMSGIEETRFAPEDFLTRAMLAQIIYNMRNGAADVDEAVSSFSDVPEDVWYSRAVSWAQEKGIVLGLTPDTFGPNENVTREQLLTMLYRCYGSLETFGDLSGFPDADTVSGYAVPAMTWAVEKGIVLGTPEGLLNPQGGITRGEIAGVLVRFGMTAGDLFQRN